MIELDYKGKKITVELTTRTNYFLEQTMSYMQLFGEIGEELSLTRDFNKYKQKLIEISFYHLKYLEESIRITEEGANK